MVFALISADFGLLSMKSDSKLGLLPLFTALNLNLPFHALDKIAHGVEAITGFSLLGGVTEVENFRLNFFGDADAIVANLNEPLGFAGDVGVEADLARRFLLPAVAILNGCNTIL